jgi:ABC-type nitrate/sulfonate/bicarbonate transport system substrate-binding protein
MSTGSVLALACGIFVAYLSGANGVSKGIATLAGNKVGFPLATSTPQGSFQQALRNLWDYLSLSR